jgi:type II secretory pathway pseudopilin PulG
LLDESPLRIGNRQSAIRNSAGFTMIEIALCLAIIGFALISILLVLPSGMNTQRDTREETIIGQDASMLMETIKSGSRGDDDLTNYVYAITNYYGFYNLQGQYQGPIHVDGYTYSQASINGGPDVPSMHLTNGLRIIGLLSTPEYTQGNISGPGGVPITSTFNTLNTFYTSNHVVAYVRSFSGLAADKPPQNNQLMQEDTFSYRLLVVNAPMAVDTNVFSNSSFARELAGNMRELRLLFEWPQEPNGNVGGFRQAFRSTIAGQLIVTNYDTIPLHLFPGIDPLYFYESQSFTNAP